MKKVLVTITISLLSYNVSGELNTDRKLYDVRLLESEIEKYHRSIAEKNPDAFVNAKWGVVENPNFILGMREVERLAEIEMDKGNITWEQYLEVCNLNG